MTHINSSHHDLILTRNGMMQFTLLTNTIFSSDPVHMCTCRLDLDIERVLESNLQWYIKLIRNNI